MSVPWTELRLYAPQLPPPVVKLDLRNSEATFWTTLSVTTPSRRPQPVAAPSTAAGSRTAPRRHTEGSMAKPTSGITRNGSIKVRGFKMGALWRERRGEEDGIL